MDDLLVDFQAESAELVAQLLEILEEIEGDHGRYRELEKFGQIVDRIMGAAKSLAIADSDFAKRLELVGKYGELCKTIAYKGSQITNNEGLYSAVVACLFDAIEMVETLIKNLLEPSSSQDQLLSAKFVDRLRWISERMPKNLRGTVESAGGSDGKSIEDMLKILGVKV